MKQYEIFIIGTGATGSNLLPSLAQYTMEQPIIKSITLIDGDIVEPKNARNQKFTKKDFGKNKAEVLAQRFSRLGINISYINKYITDANDLIDLFDPSVTPIVISCVDNNNARIILNDLFNKVDSILYFDVGNGDNTERLGQLVIGFKENKKIISPPVCDYFPQILEGDKPEPIQFSCAEQVIENPQCIAVNSYSANIVFGSLVNLLSYKKITSTFLSFNLDTLEVKRMNDTLIKIDD
ncbi:ThiF family adenylyltransferase [Clostridium thermobutyricum]|uniref:ThiF family adenylyltransferase n=1 Tax=Clostridium thermobutyricum TaxID=29372 RepID=UPI0018A8AAE7|nr:ThiF family adenylyltransferase [Clostridium thermobutyricum]